ncbi:LLM class flavin-dependent oxidoreductase [Nocardioides endophyticus]|uniref:LLM class flavin-dependent oxidoreductase n=1 Tax=Nocardioides endophyticus TaxID=1353775 RepID=A0ABP8YRY5_9ACTN
MYFNCFHLMPYPHLPADFQENYESASLDIPNALYDPKVGSTLYADYIDELVSAEAAGFDGVCVNEHHSSAYGLMPSPNLIAAALVQRTERVKIAVLGNALPVRDHPLRIAEEIAMRDNMSKGRIISGFVRGIGYEYYAQGITPTHSRERFEEAHDLIVKAWTETEPFQWYGKHYEFRYVNVWPRPYQDPHPPIWVPGSGSYESVKWAAQHGYTFLSVFAPTRVQKMWFDSFRKAADEVDRELTSEQIGLSIPTFVAETDEEAHRRARVHMEWLFQIGLRIKREYYFPPGYTSKASLTNMLKSGAKQFAHLSYDDLVKDGYILVGSSNTVAEKLHAMGEDLGFGQLTATMQVGSMGHREALENIARFGAEVIPLFDRAEASA